jgi:hypothetical protein
MSVLFERISKTAELLSFVVLILGIPFALLEFRNHSVEQANTAKKDRQELAEEVYRDVYRDVDQRFFDLTKLCIDHPQLDCHSVSRNADVKHPLSDDEKLQQTILYSALTNLFEVAFVQYHKKTDNPEITELLNQQWAGWNVHIRKFLARSAYKQTWFEIRDEYDKGFVDYMDSIAPPPKRL